MSILYTWWHVLYYTIMSIGPYQGGHANSLFSSLADRSWLSIKTYLVNINSNGIIDLSLILSFITCIAISFSLMYRFIKISQPAPLVQDISLNRPAKGNSFSLEYEIFEAFVFVKSGNAYMAFITICCLGC